MMILMFAFDIVHVAVCACVAGSVVIALIYDACFVAAGRDHTTLETPVLVRSPKLSNVGPG